MFSKLSVLLKKKGAESLSLDEEFRKLGVENFLIASTDGLVVFSNMSDAEEVAAGSIQLFSMFSSFFGREVFYGIELPSEFWYFVPLEDILIVLRSKRRILHVELNDVKKIIMRQLEL